MPLKTTDTTAQTGEREDQQTPPPRPLNLTIRELPLKQAPMEAVIGRET